MYVFVLEGVEVILFGRIFIIYGVWEVIFSYYN